MEFAKTSWVDEKSRILDDGADPFQPLRKAALQRFSKTGFPTTRQERWRFTDVSDLAAGTWKHDAAVNSKPPADFRLPLWAEDGLRVVFVDGLFQPQWSRLQAREGKVDILPFSQLHGDALHEIQKRMIETDSYADQPFLHLNTALMNEGAVIRIPAGIHLTAPVALLYYQVTESDVTFHPRNLIIMGSRARASMIEYYGGRSDSRYFRNPVTDVSLGDESQLWHYALQQESSAAHHISFTRSTQGRNSLYTRFAIDFGGSLVRHDIVAELLGEGGETTLNGLYMPQKRQHVDHHTTLRHLQPHTFSRQLYKGVLNDAAHAVFNGRIFVAREAQKTDAIQHNRNLLLSDDALADTQPQLEIFADDVRCTHGGTIGQLYEEGLFYLRSRGIKEETARNLMVHAFAGEVSGRIRHEALREQVEQWVLQRLGWEASDGA